MSRVIAVTNKEIQVLVADLRTLLACMDDAIKRLEENNKQHVYVDGWDGVYSSAQHIRKQFVKIIGESNLPKIPFEVPSRSKELEASEGGDAKQSKKKSARNKDDGQ